MSTDCRACEHAGEHGEPCERIHWTRRDVRVCEWHSEYQPREPGCQCQWEIGDSPCPVHGDEESPR